MAGVSRFEFAARLGVTVLIGASLVLFFLSTDFGIGGKSSATAPTAPTGSASLPESSDTPTWVLSSTVVTPLPDAGTTGRAATATRETRVNVDRPAPLLIEVPASSPTSAPAAAIPAAPPAPYGDSSCAQGLVRAADPHLAGQLGSTGRLGADGGGDATHTDDVDTLACTD